MRNYYLYVNEDEVSGNYLYADDVVKVLRKLENKSFGMKSELKYMVKQLNDMIERVSDEE